MGRQGETLHSICKCRRKAQQQTSSHSQEIQVHKMATDTGEKGASFWTPSKHTLWDAQLDQCPGADRSSRSQTNSTLAARSACKPAGLPVQVLLAKRRCIELFNTCQSEQTRCRVSARSEKCVCAYRRKHLASFILTTCSSTKGVHKPAAAILPTPLCTFRTMEIESR